jgi:hypothetical protein
VCGLSDKEIMAELDIEKPTVRSHVTVIFRALGVHSRPRLLALILQTAFNRNGDGDLARVDDGRTRGRQEATLMLGPEYAI